MTRKGAASQCRDCCFCRRIGEALHCVRHAPTPDPATAQARWPIVRADDYCGQFCPEGQNCEASLVKREAQDATEDQSCREAAAAPDHESQIKDHRCEAALPIREDSFGLYCEIPLTQKRVAKVDPADYIWLSQFRWCCKVGRDRCYAVRHVQEHGRSQRIYMHRQIMNTPDDMICDHINHDGLDNRRKNCRNCTLEQNNANRRSSPHATSQFIGVSYCRKRDKWVSYIKHHGKSRNLGQFDRPEDAARAHDKAAWAIWGEYAHLNFPDEYPGHPAAKLSHGGP